jgi:hypothetical protein
MFYGLKMKTGMELKRVCLPTSPLWGANVGIYNIKDKREVGDEY